MSDNPEISCTCGVGNAAELVRHASDCQLYITVQPKYQPIPSEMAASRHALRKRLIKLSEYLALRGVSIHPAKLEMFFDGEYDFDTIPNTEITHVDADLLGEEEV